MNAAGPVAVALAEMTTAMGFNAVYVIVPKFPLELLICIRVGVARIATGSVYVVCPVVPPC